MSLILDVAIIGAGPYGLSLASYLKTKDVNFRIFGKPMYAWCEHMPPGMFLKSDGNSLDLPDPHDALTIQRFHAEHKQPFSGENVVSRETFISYGQEFQSRLVPEVEPENVISVEPDGDGYILQLSNQELVRTKQVVMAIGVYPFRYIPPVLASLPPEFLSHSAEYGSVEHLRGKKIAIIGAGASAIDLAVALANHGAEPTIVSRRANLRFQTPPQPKRKRTLFSLIRSIYYRICKPGSGIGSGWALKLYADAPHIFNLFPAALRRYILATTLGPASTWVTKDVLTAQRTPVLLSHAPRATSVENGKVKLTLQERDGSVTYLEADHVIGATGYKVDIEKLPFIAESIRRKIRTFDGAPELSRWFESSCPGLYFIGPASAMSFGPVMRFVYGSGFTMKTIIKRLARSRVISAAPQPQSTVVFETSSQREAA